MSNDIATITLRVNTGDLERGNRTLDEFRQAAGSAAKGADDLNSSFQAGAGSQKKMRPACVSKSRNCRRC
ncbi:hypothetical protein C5952_17680 [Cronobacter sakazakii]|uniref:hypothetical protein n=1 Tax=Cronobacter sakazakii TaxID=28141 RepID=UPI000A1072AB|nr:hypothetical protein [Cronobacter sakazakii]ELY6360293.1 hypothetical protein [Cronobacter sakazakii]PQX62855.1 hypothetical protein C5952_17680 [Cronobacter sakazakii]PQY06296.1 hypothetical protein C5936_09515 [Cronobacter sakazakii]HDK7363275.1 hypothetical protein [Cronobacter sakazakii]